MESEIIDVRKAFDADEAEPSVLTPAKSNSLGSLRSAQLPQEIQPRIDGSHQQALHRKQVLPTSEQNAEAPEVSFPPNLLRHFMHPFSSNTLVAFQSRRYAFCTSFARIPAVAGAPNVGTCPTGKRGFV